MAKSKRLNGRWKKNDDRQVEIVVDRVYKKGIVKGFRYERIGSGMVHTPFQTTHEDLLKNYTQID